MRQTIPVRCFSIALFVLCNFADGCRVLLLKRTGSTQEGQWCQIAGGIEAGESAWQTVLREAREETGLTLTRLYSADCCEQFYEAHRNAITLVPLFVGWVDEKSEVRLNHEHSEYAWVTFEEAKTLLPFPGQRERIDWVRKHFVENEPSALLRLPLL